MGKQFSSLLQCGKRMGSIANDSFGRAMQEEDGSCIDDSFNYVMQERFSLAVWCGKMVSYDSNWIGYDDYVVW